MDRNELIEQLRDHETELRELGVGRLFMFGSAARDQARIDSDVDLFFDHARGQLGLFELMEIQSRATQILGREADVHTRNSLHPCLRQGIEASAVLVF